MVSVTAPCASVTIDQRMLLISRTERVWEAGFAAIALEMGTSGPRNDLTSGHEPRCFHTAPLAIPGFGCRVDARMHDIFATEHPFGTSSIRSLVDFLRQRLRAGKPKLISQAAITGGNAAHQVQIV